MPAAVNVCVVFCGTPILPVVTFGVPSPKSQAYEVNNAQSGL